VDNKITSPQEATLMAATGEYCKMEMEMEKQTTILASLSTPMGNQSSKA
jgi:hypothetical protein